MEGKAMLFKEFAGIDAWPICVATKDTEEIMPEEAAPVVRIISVFNRRSAARSLPTSAGPPPSPLSSEGSGEAGRVA